MRMRTFLGSSSLFLLISIGCGDDKGTADSDTGTDTAGTAGTADTGESGSMSMTGDGDGDVTGDGDGDTGPGDGDGDTGCVVGSEGCPCTDGGGCDPGLVCDAGVCGPAPGDGDGDGGDGDGDGEPGDGDGDGDGGDGDGDGDVPPYQACPNGDDDCAAGEACQTGSTQQGLDYTLCTVQCFGQDDCSVDDNDGCANLPGDGLGENFCIPLINCSFGNPCPMGMQCSPNSNGPTVCLWPS
jgi:hypothetical protein